MVMGHEVVLMRHEVEVIGFRCVIWGTMLWRFEWPDHLIPLGGRLLLPLIHVITYTC